MALSILGYDQTDLASTPVTASVVTPGATSELGICWGYRGGPTLGSPAMTIDGGAASVEASTSGLSGRHVAVLSRYAAYANAQIDAVTGWASTTGAGIALVKGLIPGVVDADADASSSTNSLSLTFSGAKDGDIIVAMSLFYQVAVADISAAGATEEVASDDATADFGVQIWSKVVVGGDATITPTFTGTATSAGIAGVLLSDYGETFADTTIDAVASVGVGTPDAADSTVTLGEASSFSAPQQSTEVVLDQATSVGVGSPASADIDVIFDQATSVGVGSPASADIDVIFDQATSVGVGSPASADVDVYMGVSYTLGTSRVDIYMDEASSSFIPSLPDLDTDRIRVTN